jgi:Family of unknown function (DUF6493)
VSPLDWPALRALIDTGQARLVAAAVEGLDERQRRALAPEVRAYARPLATDFRGDWRLRRDRIAALRLAGAGCLSGADAVARWLTRRDLRTWEEQDVTTEVLRVLRARQVPWLAELTRRLASRLPSDRWDAPQWWLVAELVTSARLEGIELPTNDGFVLGWARSRRPDGRLADSLAADPFFDALAPHLLEVDGIGGLFAGSAAKWMPPEASWPLALAALATSGRLERGRLLDRCLGRLLQGGPAAELRGLLLLHEALDPTLEEVAARVRDYTRLLADGASRVAVAAQRALRRLDDAGRLEPDRLLEASRAVLFRPERQLVRGQLSWLDAAARHRPRRAAEVLAAVSVAFAQESAELQTRAVSLVVRHAGHADAAAAAELLEAAAALPADLARRVASALGSQLPVQPPTPPSALLAPTPRELPPPIGTPAELAEELAALFEGHPTVEPVGLERLLAALVAFARHDRAALADGLDPVLARYHLQSWLPTDPVPAVTFLNEYQQLSWAVLAAVAPPARRRLLRGLVQAVWGAGERRWRGGRPVAPGPRLALLYRLREIAVGLGRLSSPPLLVATPSSGSGHLDPGELVARLERAAAAGWEPWDHDLQQALLRLPRAPDPAATARARRLATPAGQRTFAWLRDGGMADPRVTRVVRATRGRPRWSPDASRLVADEVVGVFATVTPPGDPARPGPLPASPPPAARRLLPRRPPPLATVLCELPEPERWERWRLGGWPRCWPALLPSHRDAVAAQLLPWLADRSGGARHAGQVLPALAETDGPVGPGLTLALAYGLGARDPVDRAAAVDALLVLAGRHQLDGPALGVELAALASLSLLQVGRVVPALRDAARAGAPAEVWAITSAALPGLVPPAVPRPPRGVPDLLAVAAEVAGVVGGGQPIPELAAITHRGGSGRLLTESRRLQQLLADSARA